MHTDSRQRWVRKFIAVTDCTTTLSFQGPDPLSNTVVGQINFDVTIGPRIASDRNLARAVLITHKTLSDGEVKVYLLP